MAIKIHKNVFSLTMRQKKCFTLSEKLYKLRAVVKQSLSYLGLANLGADYMIPLTRDSIKRKMILRYGNKSFHETKLRKLGYF